MQLILDTETTVDLKTKMSFNDDNLEKSVSDILPSVQKEGISNGDATNGDGKAKDKLEKLKDSVIVDTERVLENDTDSVLANNKENVQENQTNSLTEHISETPMELKDIVNSINSVNKELAAGEESTEENHKTNEEHTHKLNVTEETKNDHVDKDHSAEVRNSIDTDSNEESLSGKIKNEPVTSESTVKENNGVNIGPISESDCDSDISAKTNGACVTIKKEYDETSSNILTSEVILDNVEIKREATESDVKEEVPDESQEQPETNNESIKLPSVKTEIEENSITDETEPMETDNIENDTMDENVDSIRLDFEQNNCDKQNDPDTLETEKEGQNANDPVEKEVMKTDDATDLDVDSSNNVEKETCEIGSKTTAKDTIFSLASAIVECPEQKDSETTEPVTSDSKQLNTENSDDVIYDLDDDKEKSAEPANVKESESAQIIIEDDKPIINCDDDTDIVGETEKTINEVIDLDDTMSKETGGSDISDEERKKQQANKEKQPVDNSQSIEPILKLSNTLDILSDDEEEQVQDSEALKSLNTDNKCINIDDDDDVMLIDDEPSGIENKSEPIKEQEIDSKLESKPKSPTETVQKVDSINTDKIENPPEQDNKVPEKEKSDPAPISDTNEIMEESPIQSEIKKPLIPENFLKTCKKNLVDMTREELEEFCILKIVESLLDRSNLSEIKNKQKALAQNIEDYKKKAMMLEKQNRDLQVVLKSVQEDVKKYSATPIVPLKITRSVGMQVLMSDNKPDKRRRPGIGVPNQNANKVMRTPTMQSPRPQKPPTPQIPVPRLVPANSPIKSPVQQVNASKVTSPLPNGVKSVSPAQKAEKRTHNRIQSVTVDLTDDEPPAKIVTRTAPVPPVRLVPSQNLLAAPRTPAVNSPRKVYIPISGPQGQNVRPGQTIMLKTVPAANTRQRVPPPHMVRMPQSIRMARPQALRHPAPLPECMKQYQPPNWKALPPAPDLKLAKVENGIVISWKIDGYQEDSYEEIASYQIYAYQETTSPPNTALWKKIGDVKALPLPMACTLTQFMAGYKYYFAVRAVDIRSRLGPFTLPGSILLLNKM